MTASSRPVRNRTLSGLRRSAAPLGLALLALPYVWTVPAAAQNATARQEAQQAQETPEQQAATRDAAFDFAVKSMMPLSPDQIQTFLGRLDESQKAAQSPPGTPPKAESTIETVSLDPGATPPTIHLAAGYVTTLSMLDASGQPWPIRHVTYGGNFDVKAPAENGSIDVGINRRTTAAHDPNQSSASGKGAGASADSDDPNAPAPAPKADQLPLDSEHIIHITPLDRYVRGNISVTLVGLPTPVTFMLVSDTDVVYYRYDARIPKLGPIAHVPLINRNSGPVAGDDTITSVLEGVPPSGAERLRVSGVDTRTSAWLIDNTVYLRTPLSLLSPAWDSNVSSADGTTVYTLGETPVLLLSDNGRATRVRITRREGPNGQ